MAQNDEQPKADAPKKVRPIEDAGAASATVPAKTASEQLADASRDYHRAVHVAWLRAAEESGKANLEFAAAQQQLMQDAAAMRGAAHFSWLRASQESSADGAGGALNEARESCLETFKEAADMGPGGSKWQERAQDFQRALAVASDAYAEALREAFEAYLSRVKAAWKSVDVTQADPRTIASLAAASVHAMRAAQATSQMRQ